MFGLWLIPLTWLVGLAGVVLYYRRTILALWREPVLRQPVLIIESDDWGAGPVEAQASALERLADVLRQHRDCTGRHPVMTLALVLAVPDGQAICRDGKYRRRVLDEPTFAAVRAAIEEGRRAGLFALQLHGLEHYWPPALMASEDAATRAWIEGKAPASTEALPSHLQSRWVDASELPSRPLAVDEINAAVAEEVAVFARVFGERPRVVVPPTFVWTQEVERAWGEHGVVYQVTPGWRYTCRDGRGVPSCEEGPFWNGLRAGNTVYLVRYDYFEPVRGRDVAYALAALNRAVVEGRPCLLENHRDNFIVSSDQCLHSVDELNALYRQALRCHRRLRFLSTEELARLIEVNDVHWVESRLAKRIVAFVERLHRTGRLWRLLTFTGVASALSLLTRALRPAWDAT